MLLAAKNGVNGVFTADPNTDPTARRFKTIRYEDVLARDLDVMDQAAIILARDHQLPIHVFDAAGQGIMRQICEGAEIGTFIGPSVTTELRRGLRPTSPSDLVRAV